MGSIYFFSGGYYYNIEVAEKSVEQFTSSEVLDIVREKFPNVKDIMLSRITSLGNLIVEET
jgi:hypothetical protein